MSPGGHIVVVDYHFFRYLDLHGAVSNMTGMLACVLSAETLSVGMHILQTVYYIYIH